MTTHLRRITKNTAALSAAVLSLTLVPAWGQPVGAAAPLSRLEEIGRQIFHDQNLSEPRGTACISCHIPNRGFAGNHGSTIGVPLGSRANVLGGRNAMSNAYAAFVPKFTFRVQGGDVDPVGGLFWDGRADTLAQQALGPLLNPLEMNNPDAASVLAKIASGIYGKKFRDEFGANIFSNPTLAFQKVGEAVAAYERTAELQPFTSKYDQFIQGKASLTPQEANGMKVFMDPNKGNCASCHTMNPQSANPRDSLFTDFSHYALGVPRNARIPRNANPSFYDLGLCGPDRNKPALTADVPANVTIEQFCGRFRMVSLRNTAERPAWMHNGYFTRLRDVVSFYATRNTDPKRWYGPQGVPDDLPQAYLGNIIRDRVPFNRLPSAGPALTAREIDDVVAFLRTLSDTVPAAPTAPVPAAPPPNPRTATINPFQ